MKTIQIEIPDGKRAEWINGVLTLVEDKPIEYKFKVGDRVLSCDGAKYKITGLSEVNGMPGYSVLGFDHLISEDNLIWIVQDITERIKTFMDAFNWCNENGKGILTKQYDQSFHLVHENQTATDIIAYLKLRIITAALNEGWEPTYEEEESQWFVEYDSSTRAYAADEEITFLSRPTKMAFKTAKLALYAAKQFADIYADFCGGKKGGEQ